MSSSFKRIYHVLKQTEHASLEDYLTEIIAPAFEKEEILESFFERFTGHKYSQINDIKVYTQRTYIKLDTHLTDSRPDIVINFLRGGERHVIFIENKLGSSEGHLQLKRYKDHLKLHEENGFIVHLVYITKYYDPKDSQILGNDRDKLRFLQLQWFQFYDWFKKFEEDLYCQQVIAYMEEIGLSKSRRFLPQDIYAIQNAGKTIAMLDECLDGIVFESFTRHFGKPKQWTHRTYQLREEGRYVIINDQSDWKFVGCGFWLTEEDYPEVSVFIEVSPNSQSRERLKQTFEEFVLKNEGWSLDGPDNQNSWFTLYFDKSLVHFLKEKDHIDAIQSFLTSRLQELYNLKQSNPELNWNGK